MGTTRGQINPLEVRDGLVTGLPRYLRGLTMLGFGPPFVVMLALVGVKGMSLAIHHDEAAYPADRQNLLVDPVIIDTAEFSSEWRHHLRPVLDAFWNAFGVSRCPDYSQDGQWAPASRPF